MPPHKTSKSILDTVNSKIREQTGVNQYQFACSQSFPLKNQKSFISFDIVDFYSSITESLLDQTIDSLPWVKRDSSNAFDVTMGRYDGAEICELVGLFILLKLKDTFGNNIGLYRDNGLVLLETKSGRLSDKARKELS